MSNAEIASYSDHLITQGKKLEENILELAIYSNGSITLDDLYSMPIENIEKLEKIIPKKIKIERNIKEQQLL